MIQALEGRQLLSAADFLRTDTTTGGDWRSAYGGDGYDIAQDPSSNNPRWPSYAQVRHRRQSNWTWPSGTTGLVPLENAAGSGTILAAWTAADSMDFHIDLTDDQTHQVALYSTDPGSTQQFDVLDTSTGQPDDSETLPGTTGEYIVWDLEGDVTIQVTNLGPDVNANVNAALLRRCRGTNRRHTRHGVAQPGHRHHRRPQRPRRRPELSRIRLDLHLGHDLSLRRGNRSHFQRQRHQCRAEHHGLVRPGRYLHLPGDDRRP